MEKLINKIAPYFPYNLQLYHTRLKEVFTMQEISTETDSFYYDNTVKPILRPLSDLFKEIDFSGQRFIPIEKYAKLICGKDPKRYSFIKTEEFEENRKGYDISFTLKLFDGNILAKYRIEKDMDNNDFFTIKFLLEHQFDIGGLIAKGKAIDINTIKE